jgi:hypothetical protein
MPGPAAEPPSPAVRLVNVIVDPVAAFRGIADESPWVLAFMATVAVRFASLFVFYHPSVTPLKLLAGVLFQLATVAPPLVTSAGLVWLAAKAWRVRLPWTCGFAIVAHIHLAYTLATVAIASAGGALLPESADVDLRNPPFTTLAPLLAHSAPPLAARFLSEADVRAAYVLALLWLALRAAAPGASPRRRVGVLGTVVAVRLIGVLAGALLR